VKLASGVTFAASTPSCSAMMAFTLSSMSLMTMRVGFIATARVDTMRDAARGVLYALAKATMVARRKARNIFAIYVGSDRSVGQDCVDYAKMRGHLSPRPLDSVRSPSGRGGRQ